MNTFTIFDYNNLTDSLKAEFNTVLSQHLSSLLKEIKKDDVLGSIGVEEFVESEGSGTNSLTLVTDLYSKLTAGIQVGSGNQNLFHDVLSAFTESWKQINKK